MCLIDQVAANKCTEKEFSVLLQKACLYSHCFAVLWSISKQILLFDITMKYKLNAMSPVKHVYSLKCLGL